MSVQAPGPPEGCHRYIVVEYAIASCPASCPLVDGSAKSLAGRKDPDENFDRANGVLKACKACAVGAKLACWHAPASEPVKCACPGADWMPNIPKSRWAAAHLHSWGMPF